MVNLIEVSGARDNQPVISIERLESTIHEMINQERMDKNKKPLSYDHTLAGIAKKHSQNMAETRIFSHIIDGKGATERAKIANYKVTKQTRLGSRVGVGENIFNCTLYDRIIHTEGKIIRYDWKDLENLAQSAVNGWMNSASHRQNILKQDYTREGIGVWVDQHDKVFVTQNFF